MEFAPGDTVIKIGCGFTCSVLQVTSDWYALMWNDEYLHMTEKLPIRYVEDNYVLVDSLTDKNNDILGT